jgi:hypothetical protein
MECNCCVNHEDPRGHIMGHKNRISNPPSNLNATFSEMLALAHPTLRYPPTPPQHPVHPIYGLAPPADGYQICSQCHRGFKGHDEDSSRVGPSWPFTKHVCFSDRPNPPDRTFTLGAIQVFGPQRQETRFAVTSPVLAPPPPASATWALYRERMQARPAPTEKMSMPENYRVLHQFIQKEGWLQHVDGKKPHELTALVTIGQNDTLFPRLASHVRAHLECYQPRLKSYHARRLISTRPSAE